MKLAAAILVLLTHAGYWVGGHEQSVSLQWPIDHPMPDAIVRWELKLANVTLAADQIALSARDAIATIRIAVPPVREHTELRFVYRVLEAKGNRELTRGDIAVQVYADQLKSLASLSAGSSLLVVDDVDKLPALLKAAGATFDRADNNLLTAKQKIILFGENQLGDKDPAIEMLQALARGGASVLVLKQTAAARVWKYEYSMRDVTGYTFAADHPLLRHLPTEAWSTMLNDPPRQPALSLPVGEPALAVIHSPVEAKTVSIAPSDALLVTRTIGDGRLVFCQLPLNDAATDARQQQLLVNLIEYARTRPQPTPSQAEAVSRTKQKLPSAVSEVYGR
ncbi:hypothetical protein BH10PLA1_BH10PLA1_06560 [soil metagenome]